MKNNTGKLQLNINLLIIALLLINVFLNIFLGNTEETLIKNIVIVLSIDIIIISIFELWRRKNISLNTSENLIIGLLTNFFINEGFTKEQIKRFVSPYFSAYSKKQVEKVINSTTDGSYNKHRLINWENFSLRQYVMFIVVDILNSNNIKGEINKKNISKLSEIIIRNSQKYKTIEFYIVSSNDNKNKYFSILEIWNIYKKLGILPGNNNLFLQKILSREHDKEKKQKIKDDINKVNQYQRLYYSNFSKYENLTLTIIKISLVVISVLSVFLSAQIIFALLYVAFIFIISQNKLDTFSENKQENLRISSYRQILLAELIVNFVKDRYNADKEATVRYVKRYVSRVLRFEILAIINDNKLTNDICKLINDTDFRKKEFIHTLFNFAAADKYFSDKEDEYIYMVADLLNFPRKELTEIRNGYLKRGVKEKKIQQKAYKKSYSKASSSMYVFYSEKAYKILGIEKTASAEEIKKAYRSLVMKNHPDKFAMQGRDAMEKAEEKFQIITEAYELIKRLKNIS